MWHFQNSKRLIRVGVLIGCTVMLSGCEGLNSQFTCPMTPGVTCQSLDQVNAMVDQGKLTEAKEKPTPPPSPKSVLTANVSSLAHDSVTRSSERVMRLWIAPYQDSQGNYFSSTQVYHVIQPGHWSNDPVIEDSTHV